MALTPEKAPQTWTEGTSPEALQWASEAPSEQEWENTQVEPQTWSEGQIKAEKWTSNKKGKTAWQYPFVESS